MGEAGSVEAMAEQVRAERELAESILAEERRQHAQVKEAHRLLQATARLSAESNAKLQREVEDLSSRLTAAISALKDAKGDAFVQRTRRAALEGHIEALEREAERDARQLGELVADREHKNPREVPF